MGCNKRRSFQARAHEMLMTWTINKMQTCDSNPRQGSSSGSCGKFTAGILENDTARHMHNLAIHWYPRSRFCPERIPQAIDGPLGLGEERGGGGGGLGDGGG